MAEEPQCPTPTAARSRHAFGHEDMLALAERFQRGRLSARDAQRIIAAGLRGAGHDIADAAVAAMRTDGGATGYVDIVARLLSATFGGVRPVPPEAGVQNASDTTAATPDHPACEQKERVSPSPFPGPT